MSISGGVWPGDPLHCHACGAEWLPPRHTDSSLDTSVKKHWKECPKMIPPHLLGPVPLWSAECADDPPDHDACCVPDTCPCPCHRKTA